MKRKMNKKNKAKSAIVLLLAVCLVFAYFALFNNVNSLYPQNKRTVYEEGSTFVTQNAEFAVEGSDLLGMAEIESDKELVAFLEKNTDYLSGVGDLNMALIQLVIKNPTKEPINVDLTAFHLESGSFSSQFYYLLMYYYNECGMYIDLDAGEEKRLTVPVPIPEIQFLNYSVENIQNCNYYLVCSLYPEKIMAEVKFNNN